jgi:hypothetical protein
MKKIFLLIALCMSSFSQADETCADFIAAIKSNNIRSIFSTYVSAINDMGLFDSATYQKKFMDAPDEGGSKQGKQWMLQRAYTKCIKSSLDTKLADVIKVTM